MRNAIMRMFGKPRDQVNLSMRPMYWAPRNYLVHEEYYAPLFSVMHERLPSSWIFGLWNLVKGELGDIIQEQKLRINSYKYIRYLQSVMDILSNCLT